MRRLVTLVVFALVVALGARYYSDHNGASATSGLTPTTTTIAPHYPTAPLTGLADPSGVSQRRPALTIKIENTPEAMPQWGVDQADVVYEEIVNGGITRLAAVFNSHAPPKVGPVRSVRPTDTQVVYPLGGLFAFSGGAPYALKSIATAPVKLIDESTAGDAMYRDPRLLAPHNLFARAPLLFAQSGTPTPPPALFHYRPTHSASVGSVVSRVVVGFPSIYPVTWTWNGATDSFDRTLFGRPDLTGTGVRESPQNVIVMFVNYVNGVGTMASYANLQGTGTAAVFSGGRELRGTWARGPSPSDVITYSSYAGQPIELTPGQTWVELLNVGATLTVTP